jgi:hypothetical protein
MAVLPGVLGCRSLRRTVQVRLGTNSLRLPGGTPIFVVSRQQFMKYPGLMKPSRMAAPRSGAGFRFWTFHPVFLSVVLNILWEQLSSRDSVVGLVGDHGRETTHVTIFAEKNL